MNYTKFIFVLLFAAQLLAADPEREAFFVKRPSLQEAKKFFHKTSPGREIQFLESEKQMKFSLFSKIIAMEGEIAGATSSEKLSSHLDQVYLSQISYFHDIEALLSEGGELYYVHFLTSDKAQEALGYIALMDGNIIYDDTFNLVAESKLELDL